ncbi:Tubby-like F-box protein 10 [Acorus calamus]|uniref:Tubby-like F-box protein 10 n=1 Tax=Acorus calamus TaxID=4465 RepID=A0AAV9DT36_ACOCL|nr:Tubby-like F-box protein 10 [Acorus calamus]
MMRLKSIVRDGIGSLSRRGRPRRKSAAEKEGTLSFDGGEEAEGGRCWAKLPPELMREVVKRLDEGEEVWPGRSDVVACAAVCRSWRHMCKEIFASPETSTKLTFPISLKQVRCLGPTIQKGKFLLAARKTRCLPHKEYVISLVADDVSPNSVNYMGKLRSNFLGSKFTIYDNQPPRTRAVTSTARSSRQFHSRKVSPTVPSGSYEIAHIAYEIDMLQIHGPRRMWYTMHSIPSTALEPNGSIPCHNDDHPLHSLEDPFSSLSLFEESKFDRPLIMKNKAPMWHKKHQFWCLNFRGRVTIASVKNFQLIAASDEEKATTTTTTSSKTASQSSQFIDPNKIILQYGKIGKDLFTMDYRYPLSAFEAFGICLSSFDFKLACD